MEEKKVNKDTDNNHTFTTIKAKPVKLSKKYRFFNRNIFFVLMGFIGIFLVKIIFYRFYGFFFLGLRVKNKKYYKELSKKSTIIVSNHILPIDAFLMGSFLFPKKIYVTMLQSNLGLPIAGRFFRIIGGVPLPATKDEMIRFMNEMKIQLDKKRKVLVYPEAALKPYHIGIRPFMNGAFRFAVDCNSVILPSVYIYKKPKGFYKLKKRPCIQLHFLEPIYINTLETKFLTVQDLHNRTHKSMTDYFNAHSDYKEETNE